MRKFLAVFWAVLFFSLTVSFRAEASVQELIQCKSFALDRIEFFFPSDGSSPHETMLIFRGSVSIECLSKNSYQLTLNYSAERLQGRSKGDVSDVRFRVALPENASCLAPVFRDGNSFDFFDLKRNDRMSFHIMHFGPNFLWKLEEAKVIFYEKSSRVAATFYIPILIPSSCE